MARTPSYDSPEPGWLALIGFLFVARFLRPENAQFGDTLWISGLWLALATLWCWQQARRGGSWHFGVLDGCAWGLALAHVLATVPIFLEGGDRRGAVNVVWEWIGLAGGLFLIRQIGATSLPRRLILIFAATMAALAGLGIWQYHVSIPELASRYAELRAEEQALLDEAGAINLERLAAVRDELATFGAPIDETARIRWENRLRHSTEPFATFALANTLAGLLAMALPLLLMRMATPRRSWRTFVVAAAMLLVLYCLILTKSRTAWVGLAAGMVIGIVWQLTRVRWQAPSTLNPQPSTTNTQQARQRSLSRLGWLGGGLLIVASLGIVIVFMAGGLDREVLSEAPKSLQYRLEYWQGTLALLADDPILGTGPANFRADYMQHRLLGASEAIAAPHNLFLEIWTAGGLLGVLILLGMLGYVAWRMIQQRQDGFAIFRDEPTLGLTACEWGGLAAFFIVALLYFATGAAMDWRLVAIAPIFLLVAFAGNSKTDSPGLGLGLIAGLVALLVHLLGADGIEFPVVVQSLYLFAIAIDGPATPRTIPRRLAWAPPISFAALAVGLLMTGLVPVLNSSAHLMRAKSLAANGQPGIEPAIDAAAAADPWSLRPLIMRAELETRRALASGGPSDRNRAVNAWNEVLAADPGSVFARRQLAGLLLTAARNADNGELALKAAGVLEQAARRSPTEVDIWIELASAWNVVGNREKSAQAARRALFLDDINRRREHRDLILDKSVREKLEQWGELGRDRNSP